MNDQSSQSSKQLRAPIELHENMYAICLRYRKNQVLQAEIAKKVGDLREAIDQRIRDYQPQEVA